MAALLARPLLPVRVENITAELRSIGMKISADGTFWKLNTVSHFTVKLSDGTVIRNVTHEAARPWFARFAQDNPTRAWLARDYEKLAEGFKWASRVRGIESAPVPRAPVPTHVLNNATGDIHALPGKLPQF